MEMKDSGERQQFEGGAQRDTAAGKPKMGLLSPYVYYDCVRASQEETKPIDARQELARLDDYMKLYVLSHNRTFLRDVFKQLLAMYGYARLCDWLEKGSIKYSAFNWSKGMPFSRVLDSYLRHRANIHENDEDHPAAMMCNVMFLLHYTYAIEDGLLAARWNDLFDYKAAAPVAQKEPDAGSDNKN